MKKTTKRIGAILIVITLVFAMFCSLASGDDDSGSSSSSGKSKGGEKTATCNYCHGSGRVNGEKCPWCNGSGKTYDNYFNDILG